MYPIIGRMLPTNIEGAQKQITAQRHIRPFENLCNVFQVCLYFVKIMQEV